jgi:hypothetical protein
MTLRELLCRVSVGDVLRLMRTLGRPMVAPVSVVGLRCPEGWQVACARCGCLAILVSGVVQVPVPYICGRCVRVVDVGASHAAE